MDLNIDPFDIFLVSIEVQLEEEDLRKMKNFMLYKGHLEFSESENIKTGLDIFTKLKKLRMLSENDLDYLHDLVQFVSDDLRKAIILSLISEFQESDGKPASPKKRVLAEKPQNVAISNENNGKEAFNESPNIYETGYNPREIFQNQIKQAIDMDTHAMMIHIADNLVSRVVSSMAALLSISSSEREKINGSGRALFQYMQDNNMKSWFDPNSGEYSLVGLLRFNGLHLYASKWVNHWNSNPRLKEYFR
jgi:hypothetical protein